METDKELEAQEEKLKLMKGEVRQLLTGVRDYLFNMEQPSSEFSTDPTELGDGDTNADRTEQD
jgi:hypothetical protein